MLSFNSNISDSPATMAASSSDDNGERGDVIDGARDASTILILLRLILYDERLMYMGGAADGGEYFTHDDEVLFS